MYRTVSECIDYGFSLGGRVVNAQWDELLQKRDSAHRTMYIQLELKVDFIRYQETGDELYSDWPMVVIMSWASYMVVMRHGFNKRIQLLLADILDDNLRVYDDDEASVIGIDAIAMGGMKQVDVDAMPRPFCDLLILPEMISEI